MKIVFIVASLACAFLLSSCADNSLMTDEEYRTLKGPAAFSPDHTGVLPDPTTGRRAGGY